MIKLKNLLAANMRRFGTKNLSEANLADLENTLGFDSHNHIEDCIRKGNKTSYGYKWKLELYENNNNDI